MWTLAQEAKCWWLESWKRKLLESLPLSWHLCGRLVSPQRPGPDQGIGGIGPSPHSMRLLSPCHPPPLPKKEATASKPYAVRDLDQCFANFSSLSPWGPTVVINSRRFTLYPWGPQTIVIAEMIPPPPSTEPVCVPAGLIFP